MNFAGDLYGDVLRVRFLHRLRDEKKFGSVDELRMQINRDVNRAAGILKGVPCSNKLSII